MPTKKKVLVVEGRPLRGSVAARFRPENEGGFRSFDTSFHVLFTRDDLHPRSTSETARMLAAQSFGAE